MVVVKVVEQDIADKIDTEYIEDQFSHLENIGIVFVCAREGEADADYVEDGIRYIVINLPYEDIRQLEDARRMMLAKVKERLGLVAWQVTHPLPSTPPAPEPTLLPVPVYPADTHVVEGSPPTWALQEFIEFQFQSGTVEVGWPA